MIGSLGGVLGRCEGVWDMDCDRHIGVWDQHVGVHGVSTEISVVMMVGSRGQIPVLWKEERMFAEVNDFRCTFP